MQPQQNLSMWMPHVEANLVSSCSKQGAQMPKVRLVWFGVVAPTGFPSLGRWWAPLASYQRTIQASDRLHLSIIGD